MDLVEYVIQAGCEVRVMVQSDKIDDTEAELWQSGHVAYWKKRNNRNKW